MITIDVEELRRVVAEAAEAGAHRALESMARPATQTIGRLMTVVEAAAVARLSPRTVRARIASGAIPSRLVGRRRLITEADLAQYLSADAADDPVDSEVRAMLARERAAR
jgi:excisionase family DNA binding protein